MKVIADPRDGEVVGMVARPLSQMLPLGARQVNELTFIVQTATANEPAIRAALMRADPRLAAYDLVSLGEVAGESRITERFIFVLVTLFGVLGLVLAAVGLYGLLALQVARRWREFGIRSALGATGAQIVRLIARQGATLLASGFAAGALATWAVVRIVQSQWSQMPAPNLLAWFGAGVVLAATVAVACWLPARRAARVDPVIALRAE
jgi:ABC-type antimicrobial peptide transport system permease subunit